MYSGEGQLRGRISRKMPRNHRSCRSWLVVLLFMKSCHTWLETSLLLLWSSDLSFVWTNLLLNLIWMCLIIWSTCHLVYSAFRQQLFWQHFGRSVHLKVKIIFVQLGFNVKNPFGIVHTLFQVLVLWVTISNWPSLLVGISFIVPIEAQGMLQNILLA